MTTRRSTSPPAWRAGADERASGAPTWDTVRASEVGPHVRDERGDIISSWLVQLLLIMAVVGLVGYELLSIAITTLTLDGDAEQVADAAADAYERDRREDDALEAAEAEAERRGASVVDLVIGQDAVEVTVSKATPTLVVHRIPGLEGTADVAATRRSGWGL